jgi:hypothetical protein
MKGPLGGHAGVGGQTRRCFFKKLRLAGIDGTRWSLLHTPRNDALVKNTPFAGHLRQQRDTEAMQTAGSRRSAMGLISSANSSQADFGHDGEICRSCLSLFTRDPAPARVL